MLCVCQSQGLCLLHLIQWKKLLKQPNKVVDRVGAFAGNTIEVEKFETFLIDPKFEKSFWASCGNRWISWIMFRLFCVHQKRLEYQRVSNWRKLILLSDLPSSREVNISSDKQLSYYLILFEMIQESGSRFGRWTNSKSIHFEHHSLVSCIRMLNFDLIDDSSPQGCVFV